MRSQVRHIAVPGITPLVDVVFLLIIFFVLVSRVVDMDRVRMDLPAPNPAATMPQPERPAAVVNVIPGDSGRSKGYRLDGQTYSPDQAGEAGLQAALAAHLRSNAMTSVVIRADRQARSGQVLPVIDVARQAASAAGMSIPIRVELAVEAPQ